MNKVLKWLSGWMPRLFPTGVSAFNDWLKEIIAISGLPDNDSTRLLAASFIFNMPRNVHYLSYRAISKQLVRAAAIQVSAQVVKDINAAKQSTNS